MIVTINGRKAHAEGFGKFKKRNRLYGIGKIRMMHNSNYMNKLECIESAIDTRINKIYSNTLK